MNQIMSNNKPIKLSKVIQFADSGDIRRINKGYYGDSSKWNPQGDITLYPIEQVSTLEKKGIIFEQRPSLEEYTTFVEVIPNIYACSEREKYAPAFIKNKQKVIAVVLQKLGIHEYYISSDFQANAEMSRGDNKERGTDLETKTPKGPVSVNIENTKTQNSGFNAEVYYVKKEYSRFKGCMPSMKEWREARNLALDAEVYSDISDIIEMRNPSNNNCLECKHKVLDIGGNIDLNISLASSLKTIAEIGALGKIGYRFLKSFDINAKLNGHYKTVLFYNFNPEYDSEDYQDFVKEQRRKDN